MKIINSKQIYKLLNMRKKVGKMVVSESEFDQWINTINAINMLPEETMCFNGNLISSYEVPNFLKDLILPEKVSIDGTRVAANLRRIDIIEGETLTYIEFNDVTQALLGAFKESSANVTSITRGNVNLADVKDRIVKGKWVHDFECMPIALTINPLFKQSYYSTEADEAILNLISQKIKDLSK